MLENEHVRFGGRGYLLGKGPHPRTRGYGTSPCSRPHKLRYLRAGLEMPSGLSQLLQGFQRGCDLSLATRTSSCSAPIGAVMVNVITVPAQRAEPGIQESRAQRSTGCDQAAASGPMDGALARSRRAS